MAPATRGRVLAAVVTAAVSLGSLAACADAGSGPSDTAATSPPATADGDRDAATASGFSGSFGQVIDEYAAQAEELQAQTLDIPEGDEQRLLELLEQLATNATATREALADIAVPRAVAAEMTTILQLLEDQAATLGELAEAVRDRDDTGFQAATSELIQIAQESAEARRRMDAAIADCGPSCT